jgi:sec-independent protein translocase protein TatA
MGGGEILLILLAVLILFGADKLPEVARGIGKGMREFQKAADEIKSEITNSTSDIRNQMDDIRSDIRDNVSEVRQTVINTNTEIKNNISDITNEKHTDKPDESYRIYEEAEKESQLHDTHQAPETPNNKPNNENIDLGANI